MKKGDYVKYKEELAEIVHIDGQFPGNNYILIEFLNVPPYELRAIPNISSLKISSKYTGEYRWVNPKGLDSSLSLSEWKPIVDDYVVLTDFYYCGQTFQIKIVHKDFYNLKNNPFNYPIQYLRPATKAEIEKYKESQGIVEESISPFSIPKEGKVAGNIVDLEKVTAILRSSGRVFGNLANAPKNIHYEGIAWNTCSVYFVQKISNSCKPLVRLEDMLSLYHTAKVSEKYNYSFSSSDAKVPKDFNIFQKFLIERGGLRLLDEFGIFLKNWDLSKIPLGNIIFSGIVWNKGKSFVDWSIIDRDWKDFYRNYEKLEEIHQKSLEDNITDLTLNIDIDNSICNPCSEIFINEFKPKIIHVDLETSSLTGKPLGFLDSSFQIHPIDKEELERISIKEVNPLTPIQRVISLRHKFTKK